MKTTVKVKEVRIRRKDGLYFETFPDGNNPAIVSWTNKTNAMVFPSRNQAKGPRDQIKKYHPSFELNLEANFIETE